MYMGRRDAAARQAEKEQLMLRFRAFSVSLAATALLIVALATSWAYVLVKGTDDLLMRYGFGGVKYHGRMGPFSYSGDFFRYEGMGFYIVSIALILLVGAIALSALLTVSVHRRGWPLKEEFCTKASVSCMALAGAVLVLISVVAPMEIMGLHPFIWHTVTGETITSSVTPGLAWYLIIVFIFLQLFLLSLLRRMGVGMDVGSGKPCR